MQSLKVRKLLPAIFYTSRHHCCSWPNSYSSSFNLVLKCCAQDSGAVLHEAPDPLRLIVWGHVGSILAWSSSMGHWLSHVWRSFLIEIQFINPVIRTAIESVKCFFHTELTSVWPFTSILINCALFLHLVYSSSLEIYYFMLIFPLFVSLVVFIWQSFRLWTVPLFSCSLVCACAFNVISVRTCHFPELTFFFELLILEDALQVY